MDYIKRLLENRKRDRRIVRMVEQGTKQAEVARKLGMHRQQVSLIVKRSRLNGEDKT
jgi:transcriptional regulator